MMSSTRELSTGPAAPFCSPALSPPPYKPPSDRWPPFGRCGRRRDGAAARGAAHGYHRGRRPAALPHAQPDHVHAAAGPAAGAPRAQTLDPTLSPTLTPTLTLTPPSPER
eukprot:6895388-Prymnesium_polylepis.1